MKEYLTSTNRGNRRDQKISQTTATWKYSTGLINKLSHIICLNVLTYVNISNINWDTSEERVTTYNRPRRIQEIQSLNIHLVF